MKRIMRLGIGIMGLPFVTHIVLESKMENTIGVILLILYFLGMVMFAVGGRDE